MKTYSTREAAKMLGLHLNTLQRYIAAGKISAPRVQQVCGVRVRPWTANDVERVRKELPGVKNGRRKRNK